jgi:hypothetical protein
MNEFERENEEMRERRIFAYKKKEREKESELVKRVSRNLRNVSPPLEERRLGLVLDVDMLRCTPRCCGLCTDELVALPASVPAKLRNEREDPDREPSDSGYEWENGPLKTVTFKLIRNSSAPSPVLEQISIP